MKQKLLDEIAGLRSQARADLGSVSDLRAVEDCRIKYLGKKGLVTAVLKAMQALDASEKPAIGKEVNALKQELESQIRESSARFSAGAMAAKMKGEVLDVTLSGRKSPEGHLHPLRRVMDEIILAFTDIGFSVYDGPEIETDYYNFEALNVPKDHPARDMQDTFFVENGFLLRTHTSPVQIRVMEKVRPPIAAVFPGAVYRRDNDVTHSPMFYQVEGLMVGADVTMGNLKAVLSTFCRRMFGEKVAVRFRPSFFPFTEPSAEIDIGCVICGSKGCRVCKDSGWLEVLGCGMVDPEVFKHAGVDDKKFSGFAFGMGVDRIAMLKYAINDIRLFYENDVRFLEQF